MKKFLGGFLESACSVTHPIVLHRPWLWFFPHCPLVAVSLRLEDRWNTGVWKEIK